MKFQTLQGSVRSVKKPQKYLIKWEKPSLSEFQFSVKEFLKTFWENQVVFEEFPIAGTKLSLDFFNASKNIAIEVQGAQHTKYTPFFHGNNKSNFIAQLRRDKDKLRFCEINNIKLVEIYPEDKINKTLFKKQGVILL